MSRLLLIIIAVPLVLIIAAAILIPLLIDKDKILELAAAEVHKQTGATLEVSGDINLSIFPTLGVSLGETSVTMPEEQTMSLTAQSLEIGVQLLPLLSQKVEINTIALDGVVVKTQSAPEQPTLEASKLSDEELDAFYAERRKALADAGESAGAEAALAVPLALNVGELSVTNSRLETTDTHSGEVSVVELLNINARDLNLDGRPIPLKATVRRPGEQPLTVELDGSVRVPEGAQTVGIDELSVMLSGATPQPVKLTASGEVNLPRQIADLKLVISTGETRGDGQLRYASFESPQIDARMALNLLDPSLLVLAGPEATGEVADAPKTDGDAGDQPLPLDAIRAIDTQAVLEIAQAKFDAHTIENMKVSMRALDGVINISSLTGKLHGGVLDLKAKFNGKHNVAKLTTDGGINTLDIPTALKAMESEPVLEGTVDLNWELVSRGSTVNELVAAMAGPIILTANNALLKEVGVEEMMCKAVALANQESLSGEFPADSAFGALSAQVQVAEGKAHLQPLLASLPQIALSGSGYFDLVDQSFDTTFKARLSAGLEELDPACRVNDRLTAIDWPVKCAGDISGEPGDWCSVDSASIIEDLATQEVERKVQKEVERKFGKEAGGLLNNLFGK